MRPSDVPTYVEAGAADLGHHRQGRARRAGRARASTSCSTSASGRCRMVFATVDGRGPGGRGAAPPRRDADRDEVPADRRRLLRAHRPPGRDRRGQGLGRARAADRARRTGSSTSPRPARPCARTAWSIREEIARLDRAADRQPGRLPGQGARRSTTCVERLRAALSARPAAAAVAARGARAGARRRRRWPPTVAEIVADVRARAATRRWREYEARFGAASARLRVPAAELAGGAATRSTPRRPRGPGGRRSPTCAPWPRPGSTRRPRSTLPQGQTVRLREVPVRRAAVYAPGGPAPVPVVGRHGRGHRARGRGRRGRRRPPRRTRSILAAAALCGVDEVYRDDRRAGDRRARLRHRVDPARRRDRRARAASTCRRPSARSRGLVGIDGFAGPSRPRP